MSDKQFKPQNKLGVTKDLAIIWSNTIELD